MAETDDVTPDSSAGEEPKKSGPPAEALSTDTPDDKGTYVPRSRLNKANEEARAAAAKAEELQERLERLEAESLNREPADVDPATKDARELIEETAAPLIERNLSELKKETAKLHKEIAALRNETSQSTQEVQWQKMCAKHGADPDNQELIAVTAGLAHANLTAEDALKRALQLLPGAARQSPRGASVESKGFDAMPQSSDWVPKTNAEAAKGAAAGKRAKQLSSQEIYALKNERAG